MAIAGFLMPDIIHRHLFVQERIFLFRNVYWWTDVEISFQKSKWRSPNGMRWYKQTHILQNKGNVVFDLEQSLVHLENSRYLSVSIRLPGVEFVLRNSFHNALGGRGK